jgi:hypothetical protein
VLRIDYDGNLVWDRIHGSKNVPLDIIESGDGGYVVAGFTQRGNMGRDAYLTRIDADGEMIWETWYGGPLTDSFETIVPSSDRGFVAAGYSSSFSGDRDVYILKIDAEGRKVWEKTYGTRQQDWAEDIALTRDGGFLVVGNTESSEIGDSSYFYVLRIDKKGEKVWEKNYAYGEQTIARGVVVSDQGYIIAGSTITMGDSDIYLLMIDDRGDVVWQRTYKQPFYVGSEYVGSKRYESDSALSITNSENGFIVVAYFGAWERSRVFDSYVFRIDGRGEKVWEKETDHSWEQPWGFVATEVCDGGLILAGVGLSRIGVEGEMAWWTSLNSLEFDRRGGSTDVGWDQWWLYPCSMTEGDDGTFVVAGMTDGPPSSADLYQHEPELLSIDSRYGVMHVAKYRDPDLTALCPEPIPEPIAEPTLLLVISTLILMPLLLLLVPGLLRRARARGT